jgi:hypothetical protein
MNSEKFTKTLTHKSKDIQMEKFDIDSWCKMFWSNRADSTLHFMSADDFALLCRMDDQLVEEHKKNRTDPFEISKTCREMGGMIMLVRLRTLAVDFKCTEAVCAFIMQIARTPGKAVMYCYAFKWMWEHSKSTSDVPNMYWIAHVLDDGESQPWSLPDENHMNEMWELQKIKERAQFTDNWLDMLVIERKAA